MVSGKKVGIFVGMKFGGVGISPKQGPTMPLTDIVIRKTKPGPKTIKMSDGGGV